MASPTIEEVCLSATDAALWCPVTGNFLSRRLATLDLCLPRASFWTACSHTPRSVPCVCSQFGICKPIVKRLSLNGRFPVLRNCHVCPVRALYITEVTDPSSAFSPCSSSFLVVSFLTACLVNLSVCYHAFLVNVPGKIPAGQRRRRELSMVQRTHAQSLAKLFRPRYETLLKTEEGPASLLAPLP